MMKRIQFSEVCRELHRILCELGMSEERANRCAAIFTENTCDGVASHGLNRFPKFVSDIKSGVIDIEAQAEVIKCLGAIEQWDGKRGIGPLNAEKAINRAIELSRENGIGCVGLSNTNHWMRGGTYGLLAADAGCIGICWTNTMALMPPWGAAEKKIGNNPMVVCIPNREGPVLLDMAMSQFSNGKLEVLRRRGEQLPLVGGYDADGELTTDPNAILQSSRALPIGYWKGSGLALVLDLMASLISGGDSTREISGREQETGVSQVFLSIDIASQSEGADIGAKVDAILEDFLQTSALEGQRKIRYPGQGMLSARKENMEEGIPVEPELWQHIKLL